MTEEWIELLLPPFFDERILAAEFRATAMHAFQSLHTFCAMSNRTITAGLTQFYANQYVAATLTPMQTFRVQTKTIFEKFLSSTTNDLLLSLKTVQDITHVNGFWSGRMTNFVLAFIKSLSVSILLPHEYGDCSCKHSVSCVDQSLIWADLLTLLPVSLPGLYRGCLSTSAMLRSTLECFYNSSCIKQLQSYFNTTSTTQFSASHLSSSSRYATNSTVQEIVDQLMVEGWNWSATYEAYYQQCQPSRCTYALITRNDVLYIVTTLFGLVGV